MIFNNEIQLHEKEIINQELKKIAMLFKRGELYQASQNLEKINPNSLTKNDLEMYKKIDKALAIEPKQAIIVFLISASIFISFLFIISLSNWTIIKCYHIDFAYFIEKI